MRSVESACATCPRSALLSCRVGRPQKASSSGEGCVSSSASSANARDRSASIEARSSRARCGSSQLATSSRARRARPRRRRTALGPAVTRAPPAHRTARVRSPRRRSRARPQVRSEELPWHGQGRGLHVVGALVSGASPLVQAGSPRDRDARSNCAAGLAQAARQGVP
jgi:type II secretory pathway component HofQ